MLITPGSLTKLKNPAVVLTTMRTPADKEEEEEGEEEERVIFRLFDRMGRQPGACHMCMGPAGTCHPGILGPTCTSMCKFVGYPPLTCVATVHEASQCGGAFNLSSFLFFPKGMVRYCYYWLQLSVIIVLSWWVVFSYPDFSSCVEQWGIPTFEVFILKCIIGSMNTACQLSNVMGSIEVDAGVILSLVLIWTPCIDWCHVWSHIENMNDEPNDTYMPYTLSFLWCGLYYFSLVSLI